jgi:hypothetical protein
MIRTVAGTDLDMTFSRLVVFLPYSKNPHFISTIPETKLSTELHNFRSIWTKCSYIET